MDIEWGLDGKTGELFIVQARPETVISGEDKNILREYQLQGKGKVLAEGIAVGAKIGSGEVRVLRNAKKITSFKKGEVLGLVGPNATGKTTFVRLLAGEIADDAAEYASGLVLSVKPQRLVLSEGERQLTVGEYLQEKTSGKVDTKVADVLRMDRRLERLVGTLSGGELQSLFITAALSREHEIVLLDEPSAFLDVEQRLRVAKLLREEAELKEKQVLVVDHDLQFMDAAADRLMVFSGIKGKEGYGAAPVGLKEGMNMFLERVGVTFRRDPDSGRPRANKPGSQLDTEQKARGEYYYG